MNQETEYMRKDMDFYLLVKTWVRKKSTKELANDETKKEDVEITTHKKRYISPEERQQIIE